MIRFFPLCKNPFAITLLLLTAAMCAMPTRCLAVTDLNRGQKAPTIELPDLVDTKVETAQLRGHVLVLIFGELYHDKSFQACSQLSQILKDQRLKDQDIRSFLIVTHAKVEAQEISKLKDQAAPAVILQDAARKVFETYQVTVLPSVVVVDEKGNVVHAIAALTNTFSDTLTDALLLATNKIDDAEFERRLHPAQSVTDDKKIRAQRLSQLARQLVARGLLPMATEKYSEALSIDPTLVQAHVGLGMLELRHRRLPEAEAHFQAALKQEPTLVDATLGLAMVQVARGGNELETAQKLVGDVLAKASSHSRAHYLMGVILEKRGQTEAAMNSFKRAAELLLERSEGETTP